MAGEKRVNAFEDVSLVAVTKQNLSNLYSLDIYGENWLKEVITNNAELLWLGLVKNALKV